MNRLRNYEKRIVAFIDILGFAQKLKNTQSVSNEGKIEDNEKEIKNLVSAFARIRELIGIDEPIEGVAQSRMVTQFSDSIVISFDPKEESKEFEYLLGELLFLQIDLLKYNLQIRGGISYGQLIHTDKVLFGPALVNAYRLESLAAVSPRIILPKSLYKKNSEFWEIVSKKKNEHNLDIFLSIDEDDFYYLDYFDKCQSPDALIFSNDQEYINHLKLLKRTIIKGIKTTKPGIYSKYGWMKTKWNRIIKKNQTNKLLRRKLLEDYFRNEKLISTSM